MYFRLKKNFSGQVLQLVESYRDAYGRPRHRIVISLGNAAIAEADRKLIATLVERQIYGYTDFLNEQPPQRIQSWVSTIVRRIDKYGKWHPFTRSDLKPVDTATTDKTQNQDPTTELHSIDGVLIEEVSHTSTAQVGPQLVGLRVWEELGMPEQLERLGFNAAQRQAAAVSVINRLTDPQHEYRLDQWLEQTGLPELFGPDALVGVHSDDRYYRVSDRLVQNKAAIEQHLQRRQQEVFGLDRTILLYDLTNTHFEGQAELNPKAQRGHNKQKRDDCPQISVGMVFDQHGFELAHRVFEGNKHDCKTLVDMIGELEGLLGAPTFQGVAAQRPLVIVDAGIATRKNLDLLHEKGFSYLVNDSRRGRKRYAAEFAHDGFNLVGNRDEKESVWIKNIEETYTPQSKSGDADTQNTQYTERLLLCRSDARGEKESAILSHAEQKFIDALHKLQQRVEKGKLIDEKKIARGIGKITGQHPRAQRYYTVDIIKTSPPPTTTSEKAKTPSSFTVQYQRKDDAYEESLELAGCYVLRTDRKDFTEQQIWHTYMTLTKAEDGFRALKSHLGLRPNPHHKEQRVDGHVFISVLAYHLLRFITYRLEKNKDHRNWESIRRVLQTHCYTTIVLPTKSGAVYRIRKSGEPEECQKTIYRSLGIDWKNLPIIRKVIQQKIPSTL